MADDDPHAVRVFNGANQAVHFVIRRARPIDAAALTHVHREAILAKASAHYAPAVLEGWAMKCTPDQVVRFEQEIGDPAFIFLVAEIENEVIGFGVAVPEREELRALYVKPNAAGNVGCTLLSELEEQAFTRTGALTCDASLNAVAFYKRNGYTEQGEVEHVLRSGTSITCARMRKVRPHRGNRNPES